MPIYVLHGEDVVEIGLRIEKNGRAFYMKASELAKTPDVAKLFKFLADQEQNHILQFRSIMRSGGSYQPPEAVAEEESAYIRALADMYVFTPEFPPEAAAEKAASVEDTIGIAIGVEKDSILFYRNIEDFVPAKESEVVREIRRQEEMHLRLLTEKLQSIREKAKAKR